MLRLWNVQKLALLKEEDHKKKLDTWQSIIINTTNNVKVGIKLRHAPAIQCQSVSC